MYDLRCSPSVFTTDDDPSFPCIFFDLLHTFPEQLSIGAMSGKKRVRDDSKPEIEEVPAKAVKQEQEQKTGHEPSLRLTAVSGSSMEKKEAITRPQSLEKETDKEVSRKEIERAQECLIYLVGKKLSSGHLSHLRGIASKKGFNLASSLR